MGEKPPMVEEVVAAAAAGDDAGELERPWRRLRRWWCWS
jgi:hypothetical protein